MSIGARFFRRARITQPGRAPKLARTFEAGSTRAAGRFHRATSNGLSPAEPGAEGKNLTVPVSFFLQFFLPTPLPNARISASTRISMSRKARHGWFSELLMVLLSVAVVATWTRNIPFCMVLLSRCAPVD